MRVIQQPSVATLKPARDESVDFDTTQNLFIEGDNLEVLKLLQKSYFGKVKMIYIDPPYNTGKEFIYPDDYSETLDTYLKYTGQKDSEGRIFSTNTDTEGRYHSNWLNMMYPRLYLAKNLLRDDGVIFISIDDNEQANLKSLCDQIFGEENHLITTYIQVRYPGKTLTEKNAYQKLIEQVLVYKKMNFSPIREKEEYRLDKFCWNIIEKGQGKRENIGKRDVDIFYPGEYEIIKVPPSIDSLKEVWATGTVLATSGRFFGKHLSMRTDIDGLGVLYKVYGVGDDGLGHRYFTGPKKETATKGKFYSGVPNSKRKEAEIGEAKREKPILNFHDFTSSFGNCRHEGNIDFRSGKKPIKFLKTLLNQAITPGGENIVMDFFAGASSMAHAVMDANKEDGGDRKFIMVQLPENIPEEDRQENLYTIADISKERIRRSANKIKEENPGYQCDLGVKVFKLSPSNFKVWDSSAGKDEKKLQQQLLGHVHHIDNSSTPEDILYELLLKNGELLTIKIEKIKIAGKDVFSINNDGGETLICLENKLNQKVIDAMAERVPQRVICLDRGFNNNDQLKANAVQTFKVRAQHEEREIVFMTI